MVALPTRPVSVLVGLATALGLVLLPVLAAPPAPAAPASDPVQVTAVPLVPWEIVPLPAGGSYVVQRDGGIVRLDAADQLTSTPVLARSAIPSVRKFLGLALAPDFATSGLAYLYVSQNLDPDGQDPMTGTNSIWRLRANGAALAVVGPVFSGIDSDGSHDGGRMAFGPDGRLWVTTGDVHQPTRPQDLDSYNGKILRLAVGPTGDATPPADNPFVSMGGNAAFVWSYGHRHPQGLAFAPDGRLWETEHGPTGETYGPSYPGGNGRSGRDELNLIVRGGNYGWPLVSGTDQGAGMVAPAAVAGDEAWAPGGLAVGVDGSLYVPFLAGARLHRFDVRDGVVVGGADHLTNAGRLRVAVARGNDLLVAQDGPEGRIFRLPLTPPPVPTPATSTAPATATGRQARAVAKAAARGLTTRSATRRLAAGRAVRIAVDAPSAGRLVVLLRAGSGPRAVVLVRARTALDPAGKGVVRLRLNRADRSRAADRPVTARVRVRLDGGGTAAVVRRVRMDRDPG